MHSPLVLVFLRFGCLDHLAHHQVLLRFLSSPRLLRDLERSDRMYHIWSVRIFWVGEPLLDEAPRMYLFFQNAADAQLKTDFTWDVNYSHPMLGVKIVYLVQTLESLELSTLMEKQKGLPASSK